MNKKYVITDLPTKKIIDTSPTLPKLDPAEVAKALGGEPTAASVAGPQGPITLFALRQELFRRLQSTGGRPSLPEADGITKVPTSAKERKQLEALAKAISKEGFSPSSGQVASVLLSRALAELGSDAIEQLAADVKASEDAGK
jgi:hypothetical protein